MLGEGEAGCSGLQWVGFKVRFKGLVFIGFGEYTANL
jgi:hypothetical protein